VGGNGNLYVLQQLVPLHHLGSGLASCCILFYLFVIRTCLFLDMIAKTDV
jgi:hypothetical protein